MGINKLIIIIVVISILSIVIYLTIFGGHLTGPRIYNTQKEFCEMTFSTFCYSDGNGCGSSEPSPAAWNAEVSTAEGAGTCQETCGDWSSACSPPDCVFTCD